MKPRGSSPRYVPRLPGVDYGVLDRLTGYGLRRAQLVIYDDFARSLAPWSITPQRFSALVIVARNRDLKLTELAQILGIARSGAVALVNTLAKLDYVERLASTTDKRAFRLRLTRKGRRVLEEAKRAVVAHDHRVVAMLTRAEARELAALLRRVAGLGAR